MWEKIKGFIVKYWPLILLATGIFAVDQYNASITRHLLNRDFAVLQSDLTAIKAEQQQLRTYNTELIVHATNLVEWINKYGPEIDKLGQFNTENRRQLAFIRGDIGTTKAELSSAISGVQTGIGDIVSLQGNNTENGKLYTEMERRLKELAERYGIDLEAK